MKTPSEELKSVKQRNQKSREIYARKMGYKDSLEYIAFLEKQIKGESTTTNKGKTSSSKGKATTVKVATSIKKSKVKPIIHVADVLDSSGSMSGSKHDNAKQGINKGIKSLREDKASVEYTYTLCDFAENILMPYICTKLIGVNHVNGVTRGSTALFDAIGYTISSIQRNGYHEGDKVLVNIYTDGQENASKNYTANQIALSIKELSNSGWTFTFIGTPADVQYVQRHLHIHESNTLEYDGSAKGLEESFMSTNSARSAYSKNVSEGKDVSKGFYKDIKK